jgi:Single-strand binding protein family
MTSRQLPLPLFACPTCGKQDVPQVRPGTGPHVAAAICAHCDTWLRWVPRRLLEQSSAQEALMSGSVNRTILLGVIGQHGIAVRYANSGAAIASFMLVCTEQWQDGTTHELYIPCEIVGKKAEGASELDAGTLVLFEGKLAKRKKGEQWELVVSGFDVTPVRAPAPALTGTTP